MGVRHIQPDELPHHFHDEAFADWEAQSSLISELEAVMDNRPFECEHINDKKVDKFVVVAYNGVRKWR